MKKILFLGGSRYLIPAIEVAHQLDAYVITADFLPNNVAHQYSDEYRNVSIIDKESVLSIAKELKIDGILSYATDPGVVTAAYVAEKLGLPTSPYESVALLQDKGRFRAFLRENGFNTPYAQSYKKLEDALISIDEFKFPIIVKPVDAAGSKGVSRVNYKKELKYAVESALRNSLKGEFIIEEFIEKRGLSSDTDSFSVDGMLVSCSFNNQLFDEKAQNPYTPSAYTWPSSMSGDAQKELRSELQRLVKLLNMGTTIYNIETRVGTDGKAYIMECSPRAGGNRLAEILRWAGKQDLITAAVKAALDISVDRNTLADPVYESYWGEIILHSNQKGYFKSLKIEEDFRKAFVKEEDLWVKRGDEVHCFTGANEAIGTLVLNCAKEEELNAAMTAIDKFVNVEVEAY